MGEKLKKGVCNFFVFIFVSSWAMGVFAFDPQKVETLKQAVVTIETNVSRAAYEKLGVRKSAGFICDKTRGWLVTTHDTVGYGGIIATYEITFSGGQKLDARLVYADPSKNFAILAFDPKELLVPVEEIADFGQAIALGEEVLLVGKEGEQDIIQPGLVSAKYESVLTFPQEALRISLNAAGACIGAPILNNAHQVVGLVLQRDKTFVSALWGLFIRDALAELKTGKTPQRCALAGVAFSYSLADAVRYLNFPEGKLKEFMKKYPQALAKGLVFLTVVGEGSPLKPGDVLWTIEGQEVGPSLYMFETILNKTASKTVRLGVFRRGQLIDLTVPVETLDPFPVRQMVVWGGGIFYQADRWMERLYNIPRGRVMISHTLPGSPFSDIFFALHPGDTRFLNVIDTIDGQPIHSLEDLIKQISVLGTRKYFSIQYRDFGFYVVSGGYLSISRNSKIAGVNFSASTTIPEVLNFVEKQIMWTPVPIAIPGQTCAPATLSDEANAS